MKSSIILRPAAALAALAALLIGAAAYAQPADPAQAAPARARAAARPPVSPEILPDHRVTFRYAAPKATQVSLDGDWEGGNNVAMQKAEDGVWSVTVGPLKPELRSYTFNVDGARALDTGNPDTKRDGRRIDNILLVPGPESDLYEQKDVPHGTVSAVWYPSPTLKLTRRMLVYTPPGYEDGTARYPVLYLHHGGGGDEEAWVTNGREEQIIDNLIAAGKCRPMIVVMPNMNPNQAATQGSAIAAPQPANAGAPAGGNRGPRSAAGGWMVEPYPGSYGESVVKDIIPWVEKHYRVDARSESRAIVGLSMGGQPVVLASNNNPKLFGYVGLFSSRPAADEKLTKDLTALKAAGAVKLYWVSWGTTDFARDGTKEVYELATKLGFNTRSMETPGSHSWNIWRVHLSNLAPLLFR